MLDLHLKLYGNLCNSEHATTVAKATSKRSSPDLSPPGRIPELMSMWVMCLLTYTLQCSSPPLSKHCVSFQLLGHVLIPSLNRGKGKDAQESHWGLLLPKSDHSCHNNPSPHKTAWHSLRIVSLLLQANLQKKNTKNCDFCISKSLLKKQTRGSAKSLALLMPWSFPGPYKGEQCPLALRLLTVWRHKMQCPVFLKHRIQLALLYYSHALPLFPNALLD